MNREEKFEWLLKTAGAGLLLFFGAVFSLLLDKDIEHLGLLADRLFLTMGIFILGTIALRFIFSLDCIRKLSILFSGAACIIWIFAAAIGLSVLSRILEDYIRNIIIVQALIFAVIIIGNYLYMRYISNELNGGTWKQGFKLVEDLPLKPKNEDEFMQLIYDYCRKNALEPEVIEYGMPAKIKIGNELNKVDLGSYMSLSGGVIYTLEFTNINE